MESQSEWPATMEKKIRDEIEWVKLEKALVNVEEDFRNFGRAVAAAKLKAPNTHGPQPRSRGAQWKREQRA